MNILWAISEIRTPLLDKLFQIITYFGQEVIVIAVICFLYWCYNKRLAYQIGMTYFTAGLFVQTSKIIFRIPRPWILDADFKAVDSAIAGATGYSFPSGHTQAATSLFAPLALNTKKIWLKLVFVFCFLAIGFSRMYLGVHTPKDVLVSMGISLLFSLLIWYLQDTLINRPQYTKYISAILAGISLAVITLALILLHSGTIENHYAVDCCKAAGAGLGFAAGFYIERSYLNFMPQTKTIWGQALKLIIGLGITLFIKSSFTSLFGRTVLAKMTEYFILVLWVLVIYPWLFSKFSLREDG